MEHVMKKKTFPCGAKLPKSFQEEVYNRQLYEKNYSNGLLGDNRNPVG